VIFLRRAFLFLLLICLGCSAQSTPPDLVREVQRHVRILYSVPRDVTISVGPLRDSEFPNYEATTVTLDNAGKKQDLEFLVSKDRKTLLRLIKMDLNKDPYAEVMKRIDIAGRPTRGNKDAKVVVVDYDDFECPFCARMHQTLSPAVFKEFGDRVLFVYKDYPLEEIHPWAVHAAVDANCLAAQSNDAYWDFADQVHFNQQEINKEKARDRQFATLDKQAALQGQKHNLDDGKLQACLKKQDDKAVRTSMKEADALGINATPTIFINGQKIDGALPLEEVRAAIDSALKDAGVGLPERKSVEAENAKPSK
jgi:protein-disulfide isomerase